MSSLLCDDAPFEPMALLPDGYKSLNLVQRSCRWLASFVLVLLSFPTPATADNILGPTRSTIPMPEAVEFLQGFTVQLDVAEQTIAGYVPVKITLKSLSRFPADRKFVFRFQSEPQFETPTQNGLVVDVPLTVGQGAISETFIRYLPKWSAGQAVSVIVSEDGRPLNGYATFFGGDFLSSPGTPPLQRVSRSRRRLLNDEYGINWVFLSSEDRVIPEKLPKLWGLRQADMPMFANSVGGETPLMRAGFWNAATTASSLQAIGQLDLPLDWRAYQRYDVVVMDPDGLRRLRSNEPALGALQDWVLNGGTVVVYNATSADELMEELGLSRTLNVKVAESLYSVAYEMRTRWQLERDQFAEVLVGLEESVLQVQQEIAAQKDSTLIADSTGLPSDASERTEGESGIGLGATDDPPGFPVMTPAIIATLQTRLQEFQAEQDETRRRIAQLDQAISRSLDAWGDQIQVHGVGAGYVITLDPVEGQATPGDAHWKILSGFLDHRASPTLRRGVDPLIGDRRFNRWAIPGVAQPPVYTFMGLLTVFVILVGPVAYRRTSKIGRSYLMFAIAPALALLTTVSMFAYGIISDGFGTMVRVRQLTWVDGKSGSAGERVRSTYFAGVRPSTGLQFPGGSELMIYREGTGQSWEDRDSFSPEMIGQVTVEASAQRLDSSFLPSRQQCQFVVHQPRRDVGFLQLIADPKGIQSPEVTSGFAFPLRQAVLRDDQANYWLVENLDANSVQRTQALTTREASKLLGQLYNDHRPVSEVRETRSTTNRYDNEIYDVIVDINRMLESKVTITDGLFEFWLQQNLQTSGELPKQHFVAITDISPDVLAVEGSEVKSSIRYVFGTLR